MTKKTQRQKMSANLREPPPDFVEQDGCWNCRHCYDDSSQDGDCFICFFGDKPCPPKPAFLGLGRKVTPEQEAWEKWYYSKNARRAIVKRNGKCPQWDANRR